jgi:hypothetical protein
MQVDKNCYVCELAIPQGIICMKIAAITLCNLFLVRASTKHTHFFAMVVVGLGLDLALMSI